VALNLVASDDQGEMLTTLTPAGIRGQSTEVAVYSSR